MAVTNDIMRTYRAPRAVVADLLSMGQREDRAFAYLAVGLILVFVAQLPRLSRVAFEQEIEFGVLVANTFMGILIVWPLALYGIAWLIWRATKGGGTSAYAARLSLFWAFLAASPALLLHGLVMAFIGPGMQANLLGVLWLGLLVWFTMNGIKAGRGQG